MKTRSLKTKISVALALLAATYLSADGFTFPTPATAILEVGRTYRLTWNAPPGSGQRIVLYQGGYASRELASVSTPSNRTGSYDWKPDSAAEGIQLRLNGSGGATLASTPTFNIVRKPPRSIVFKEPSLSAGSPANQELKLGDTVEVYWDYTGDTGSLDAEERKVTLDTDCALTASYGVPVGSNGHGRATFRFTAFDANPGWSRLTCHLKLYWVKYTEMRDDHHGTHDYGGYGATAISDVSFTVVNQAGIASEQSEREKNGFIDVTAPSEGTRLRVGDRVTITWNHAQWMDAPVNIELSRDFNVRTIAQGVPVGAGGRGSYVWTVDTPLSKGEGEYSIAITASNRPQIRGSSRVFLGCPVSEMRFLSPTAEDSVFEYGSTRTLSWSGLPGRSATRYTLNVLQGTTPIVDSKIDNSAQPTATSVTWNVTPNPYFRQNGEYRFMVYDTATGCPSVTSPPITFSQPGTVLISKPAAGDQISMARTGPVPFGVVSWNANLHYRNQKARITLNRASGEIAVLSQSEPIVTGNYDFRYQMPAGLPPGNDYFIKMVVTGPTAVPIEVRSGNFSLTNEMPGPIRPGPQRPPFGR